MGCADYRLYRNGDSDGDGNDLMHGVLDKKSVLEIFPERFDYFYAITRYRVFSTSMAVLNFLIVSLIEFMYPPWNIAPRPPFTFSNSAIVRARALISFCCFIILLIFNVYTVD